MKYYIIAGEASGDLHGANMMKELSLIDSKAEYRFIGGDKMQNASQKAPFIHISETAFMGFIEVAKNINAVLKNLKKAKKDVLDFKPDALILIDFPGFNLKLASFAKKHNIKVFYYISPKIWAWNQRRANKIRKVVDHMFCILPFEVDFYKQFNMEVDYVGNPLLDAIEDYTFNPDFRKDNGLDNKPIIALLPGSRKMELEKILPELINLYYLFPGYQLVIAGAPNFDKNYYEKYTGGLNIDIVFDQTYDLLKNAEAAAVTSGTATLEAALIHTPQVVVYKANRLSIWLAKILIKVKFISLVNLINGFLSVNELIQKECNTWDIAEELAELINNSEYRKSVLENYEKLSEKLGKPGASQKTAQLIYKYLT